MPDVVHPGALLEPLILEPAGLSQSAFARLMGFNQPQPINELVKGKRGITPKMALYLERATDSLYPAEFWLLAQLRWDLAQVRQALPSHRAALVQNAAIEPKLLPVKQAGQLDVLKLSKKLTELG
jgi:addiction module HigA family antidote